MSLLTADELRAFLDDQVAMDDPSLEVLIAANEAAIDRRAGPLSGVEQTVYARGLTLLPLKSEPDPYSGITVVDHQYGSDLDLVADDDYRIRGSSLERRHGFVWSHHTTVSYIPLDNTNERKAVLVALVKSDLNHEPGMASQAAGPWTETYASRTSGSGDHLEERERILDRLGPRPLFA